MVIHCHLHSHQYVQYLELDLIGSKATNRKQEKILFNCYFLSRGLNPGPFSPESSVLPFELSNLVSKKFFKFIYFFTDLLPSVALLRMDTQSKTRTKTHFLCGKLWTSKEKKLKIWRARWQPKTCGSSSWRNRWRATPTQLLSSLQTTTNSSQNRLHNWKRWKTGTDCTFAHKKCSVIWAPQVSFPKCE